MTLYAFDAAYPPPAAVLKGAGAAAVNVYVSGNFAQDEAHVKALRAAGIAPWPNYEVGLWELVSNRAAGRAAGTRGINDAIRCGFPPDGTIWFPFSVDVSVPPARYGEVAEAFRGIQDVNAGRFRISCYGQGGLIKYLRMQGVIHEKGWLSASSSFPGYDRNSSDICVWQQTGSFIPGHSTDRNVITDPHALGAWWPAGSPYEQGADMSAAEVADLKAAIAAIPTAVWAKTFTAVDGAGKPTSPPHSAAVWLANTNMDLREVPTNAELVADLAADGGGSSDPAAVAQAVVAALGPDLAKQVAVELGTIIQKGANA